MRGTRVRTAAFRPVELGTRSPSSDITESLQRFLAKRMNATLVEADSSHVPMLSQPQLVLEVIRKAAASI